MPISRGFIIDRQGDPGSQRTDLPYFETDIGHSGYFETNHLPMSYWVQRKSDGYLVEAISQSRASWCMSRHRGMRKPLVKNL